MSTTFCDPCVITDATLDILDRYDISDLQEDFATKPIQAIQPIQSIQSSQTAPLDEEALHMSFEEAISGRIVALGVNWDLTRDSSAITRRDQAPSQIPSVVASRKNVRTALQAQNWQHHISYICLALIFMLIGFDFMGLLILHMH
jgi:hypothetical protein